MGASAAAADAAALPEIPPAVRLVQLHERGGRSCGSRFQAAFSITSGRGEFHMEFSHYEELPAHLAERVIKEAKAQTKTEQPSQH